MISERDLTLIFTFIPLGILVFYLGLSIIFTILYLKKRKNEIINDNKTKK